ncbi:MAG: type II toxin-antitoxin system RelE/ParE family toxin [Acidobacteriota bacterium]
MSSDDKPLVWLRGEIRTPPLSSKARLEAGYLLRRLQRGESLSMPRSRPMPAIGARCHELRVPDDQVSWRIFYRIDEDAILILGVETKKSRATLRQTLDNCQRRLKVYDHLA